MGTKYWIEGQARRMRAAYWTHLGDPERAAAEPSPQSLAAWCDAFMTAHSAD